MRIKRGNWTKEKGIETLVIEKVMLLNQSIIIQHIRLFSSSDKLSIGDIPFIVEDSKPRRNQALVYYRKSLNIINLTYIHSKKF